MGIFMHFSTACNGLQHHRDVLYATEAAAAMVRRRSLLRVRVESPPTPCLRIYTEKRTIPPPPRRLPRTRSTCSGEVQAIARDDLMCRGRPSTRLRCWLYPYTTARQGHGFELLRCLARGDVAPHGWARLPGAPGSRCPWFCDIVPSCWARTPGTSVG